MWPKPVRRIPSWVQGVLDGRGRVNCRRCESWERIRRAFKDGVEPPDDEFLGCDGCEMKVDGNRTRVTGFRPTGALVVTDENEENNRSN